MNTPVNFSYILSALCELEFAVRVFCPRDWPYSRLMSKVEDIRREIEDLKYQRMKEAPHD